MLVAKKQSRVLGFVKGSIRAEVRGRINIAAFWHGYI